MVPGYSRLALFILALAGCTPPAPPPPANSSILVAGEWLACVRREAAVARTHTVTDTTVNAVLASCHAFAEPFESLARQEVGEEKAERLVRSQRQAAEELARSALQGEPTGGSARLYAQVRKCIDDEARLAASSDLEGEALVGAVRERCAPIKQRADAEIEANLGRDELLKMAPDIDRVLDSLILQLVADARAGHVRAR